MTETAVAGEVRGPAPVKEGGVQGPSPTRSSVTVNTEYPVQREGYHRNPISPYNTMGYIVARHGENQEPVR